MNTFNNRMISSNADDSLSNPSCLRKGIFVLPAESTSNGGLSWWLDCDPEPVLIDCPAFNTANLAALKRLARGRNCLIVLTNRDAHGRVSELQSLLDWKVLVQEQESYLLPDLSGLTSFSEEHTTTSGIRVLWTPGPTPGSCVVYAPPPWNVLFCGRLLIPLKIDQVGHLIDRKTFHATRLRNSLKKLLKWLPPNSSPSLASGVGVGSSKDGQLFVWDSWKEC